MKSGGRQFRLIRSLGFTLIELLIVMIIITLVVGSLAPKFAAFTAGRKAADAARQLVSLARYAHSQAIAEGRVYRLNVDTSRKTYWLTADKDGQFTAPLNQLGQVFSLPDSVGMQSDIGKQTNSANAKPSDGGQYVTFNPTGRSEAGSITLTDQNGHNIVITCTSATELFHIAAAGEVTP